MGLFSNIFKNDPTRPIKEVVDEILNIDVLELLKQSQFVKQSESADSSKITINNYQVYVDKPILDLFNKVYFVVFGDKESFDNINMILSSRNKRINIEQVKNITNTFNKAFSASEPFTNDDRLNFQEGYFYRGFEKENTHISLNYFGDEDGFTLTRHNAYSV